MAGGDFEIAVDPPNRQNMLVRASGQFSVGHWLMFIDHC